jgi:ribosomal protein L37AE/L43A
MDEQRCNECGSDAEYLYEVEQNVWLCESCLKEMAERVNEE